MLHSSQDDSMAIPQSGRIYNHLSLRQIQFSRFAFFSSSPWRAWVWEVFYLIFIWEKIKNQQRERKRFFFFAVRRRTVSSVIKLKLGMEIYDDSARAKWRRRNGEEGKATVEKVSLGKLLLLLECVTSDVQNILRLKCNQSGILWSNNCREVEGGRSVGE